MMVNNINLNEKIYVDDFLVDLVPGFVQHKREDLQVLHKALTARDFETVRKIGHNWKGVCPSYGFDDLGKIGRQFEQIAAQKDTAALNELLEALPRYLDTVQIEPRPESEQDRADLDRPH